MADVFVHPGAWLGEGVQVGHFAVIHEHARIGAGAVIGDHAVICEGAVIGSGTVVGPCSVIGKQPAGSRLMTRKPQPLAGLLIGSQVTIGACVVLYAGSMIADGVFIGDHASIREKVTIGQDSVVGRSVTIELNTLIGANVLLQTGSYITGDTRIEDRVFIGPCVSMSNDKYMGTQQYELKGPVIRQGAAVGNNATLLPGVEIGRHALIGGGAVVTKTVPDDGVVVGNPAMALQRKGTRPK